jgi:hypothetical protein
MGYEIQITPGRAQALLNQCRWLMVACVGLVALDLELLAHNVNSEAVALFAMIYLLACVAYTIWLGRLAHGLGRSVALWVGCTWLASAVIFVFSHIIAYFRIKAAVKKTFSGQASEPAPQANA